jgi:hypothetical protein
LRLLEVALQGGGELAGVALCVRDELAQVLLERSCGRSGIAAGTLAQFVDRFLSCFERSVQLLDGRRLLERR